METSMKSFALLSAALLLGMTLVAGDAEAKRLGGGSSLGMQRQSVTPQKSTTAAPTAPAAGQAAAAGAQPKRSWMGPLAGLAAGLGLAALASHLGLGEEFASMLMIGLLVMGAVMVIGAVMRRRAAQHHGGGGMQYAGAGADLPRARPVEPGFSAPLAGGGAAAATAARGNIPADFDAEGFIRNAKVSFIRLQAANDAGNLEDIREFTTPEMFGEIKMNFDERGKTGQQTDVVTVNGEVLDVAEEANRYIVSVRFTGLIREEFNAAAEPFDEVWHMVKPRDGSRGWTLAGIEQVQ
jgi:predicted lipid-binding transport protein (Tim44 family)